MQLCILDISLEPSEEGEEVGTRCQNQMVEFDACWEYRAVEHRIANVAVVKVRQAGDALRAIGANKAKVDCGCSLQLDFEQLIWNVGKLPAI